MKLSLCSPWNEDLRIFFSIYLCNFLNFHLHLLCYSKLHDFCFSDGVGRTGSYIAIDCATEELRDVGNVDVMK